jgi:hypothetical protein
VAPEAIYAGLAVFFLVILPSTQWFRCKVGIHVSPKYPEDHHKYTCVMCGKIEFK